MCNLPKLGIKPMSSASTRECLFTESPGESSGCFFLKDLSPKGLNYLHIITIYNRVQIILNIFWEQITHLVHVLDRCLFQNYTNLAFKIRAVSTLAVQWLGLSVGWKVSNQTEKILAPWKESYNKPRQHIKKQTHQFANKGLHSQKLWFFQ